MTFADGDDEPVTKDESIWEHVTPVVKVMTARMHANLECSLAATYLDADTNACTHILTLLSVKYIVADSDQSCAGMKVYLNKVCDTQTAPLYSMVTVRLEDMDTALRVGFSG